MKIYPLKTQPERWEKTNMVHGFFMDMFFLVYRGLVTSTIFVHSRYFRRWELQAQAHWSGHLIDGQCRVWASQLRQWRCGQHDRHQSLWRLQGVFFLQSIHPWFPRFSEAEYQRLAVLLVHCGRGSQYVFFCLALCCSKTACAEKKFLHKLEATPHLNGKHVVFGKVRSAKGAKGVNWVYSVYYFRGRCKMEFTLNFRLKSDMRPFNLLHKLKIMSCKSSCKICFFLSNFGVFSHSKGLRANWHVWGSLGQVGSSALAEVLGQTDMLAFWDSLGTNGFCLRKGSLWGSTKASLMRFSEAKALEDSKKTILYMRLPVFLWGQSCMNCWLTTPPLCRENNWSCCCCWVCDLLL